ncbi:4'-phosphopantetheinyl transferase family protein [Kitasatospora sp. NBC_01539]|uniref:4'-phosphopantetheinyl transferase family protein n=1 Tax=Kitasatospora sp. NBC_01539 TaxID=2903577 RepID=UPI0038602705
MATTPAGTAAGAGGPLALVAASASVLALPELGEHLLTPVERERADRFRTAQLRDDFVAAHLLVRLCAARLLDVPVTVPVLEQYCPDCRQAGHGVPRLTGRPEIGLSMSHTTGTAAVAAGPGPVGVDVESTEKARVGAELYDRVLTAAEAAAIAAHPDPRAAFLRQWVRKEALIKIGRATLDSMAGLDLSALPLDETGPGPAAHRWQDLCLTEWADRRSGLLLTVASAGPARIATLDGPVGSAAAVRPEHV